jgi:hypothetical protein
MPAHRQCFNVVRNMTLPKLTLFTWILIGITLILILGIPWANKYTPYTDTFGHWIDVWNVEPKNDPHYQYRYNIIVFGFILSGISVLPFVASLFYPKQGLDSRIFNTVIFLLIIALGVKNYPYWANGLFYVFSTGSVSTAYDPKAILPYIEFGETWSDIVVYFYLACIILIPTVLIRFAFKWFKNANHTKSSYDILTIFFLVLLIISFFATPNFFGWLAD